jgi:L-iditol 2-dehydrogenase
MRAVTFNVTVPGFLLGKGLGGLTESAVFGGLSGLRYGEVAEPGLPGRDWVRLEVLQAGICGTDLGTLTFQASPAMEPFGSFPAVLGHEILARVVEKGPDVRRVDVGQRVAVDPLISCAMRGFGAAPCPSCSAGLQGTCERAGEEGEVFIAGKRLRRGLTMGFQADLPGGWSERMIAHESQLFPVDDAMSDRTAALLEPLCPRHREWTDRARDDLGAPSLRLRGRAARADQARARGRHRSRARGRLDRLSGRRGPPGARRDGRPGVHADNR